MKNAEVRQPLASFGGLRLRHLWVVHRKEALET
jgi:hypothetical protein